jgi:hypothetical protein
MRFGQLAEDGGAGAGEGDDHLPVVGVAVRALYQAVIGKPVNQFNSAVMTDQKAACQFGNGGFPPIRESADSQ